MKTSYPLKGSTFFISLIVISIFTTLSLKAQNQEDMQGQQNELIIDDYSIVEGSPHYNADNIGNIEGDYQDGYEDGFNNNQQEEIGDYDHDVMIDRAPTSSSDLIDDHELSPVSIEDEPLDDLDQVQDDFNPTDDSNPNTFDSNQIED